MCMKLVSLFLLSALALSAQDNSKFTGPANANPAVTEGDIRIVQRARELLDSPAKWNRADNRECPASEATYSLYCALETATREVCKKFAHRGAAMQQARFVIDEVLAKGNHYKHRLMNYNNDPNTTFADVQKFLHATRGKSKEARSPRSSINEEIPSA